MAHKLWIVCVLFVLCSCSKQQPNDLAIRTVQEQWKQQDPKTDAEVSLCFSKAADAFTPSLQPIVSSQGIDHFFETLFSSRGKKISQTTCLNSRLSTLIGISTWNISLQDGSEYSITLYPEKLRAEWMKECFGFERLKGIANRSISIPEECNYFRATIDQQNYIGIIYKKPAGIPITDYISALGKASPESRNSKLRLLESVFYKLGQGMHAMHATSREEKVLPPLFVSRYIKDMENTKKCIELFPDIKKSMATYGYDYDAMCKELIILMKTPIFRFGRTFGDFTFQSFYYDASSRTLTFASSHGAAISLIDDTQRFGLPNNDTYMFYSNLYHDCEKAHLTPSEYESLSYSFGFGYYEYVRNRHQSDEISVKDLPTHAEDVFTERMSAIIAYSNTYQLYLADENGISSDEELARLHHLKELMAQLYSFPKAKK